MTTESSRVYAGFAGWCALLAGLTGLLYSVAFIVLQNNLLSGLFLIIGGLLSAAALLGVYARLRGADPEFAIWATLLTVTGALGAAIHGGYDLANAVNPPAGGIGELPSAVDPRGLLTFGLSGVGFFFLAWLMRR